MRPLKIVGGAIAAVLVLAILAALTLLWFVNPDDYRDDVEQLVAQKTGRQLKIGGPLDLKLFPWLALRIQEASLGNPPGFGDQPFLTVKKASVGVKLLPLLHKRLEVSRVSVDGLSVMLLSKSADSNNWKDLTASKEEAAKPSEGGPAPRASIAGVDVTNAVLVYRDEAKDSTTRLSGLELHTGALEEQAPLKIKSEFDFDQGEPRPLAHIAIETQVQLPQSASRVEIRDFTLTGKWFGAPSDTDVKSRGTAVATKDAANPEPLPLSVKTTSLLIDLDAEQLLPTMFDIELGKLPLRVSIAGEKLFSERVITGEINVPQVSPRAIMPSFGMEVPRTRDSTVLQKLSFKSNYHLTEKQLRLPTLELTLDDTRIYGAFGIDDLDKMAMSFELDVNSVDLDRYMEPKPQEEPEKAGARAKADVNAASEEPTELPIEALRKLIAKGSLRVGRAKLADLPFSQIRLPLDADQGLVKLGPTQAQLFGGGYTGNIVLDARAAQARLSLNEHVNSIDIGALMQAAFDTNRLSGRGNAAALLTASGNTDVAIFKSLSGQIQTDVKDGAFNGVDLWYELRRAWALIKRQPLPTRSNSAPRTVFKTLSGSATLSAGVMRNDDLSIDVDYLKANGKGTLDLSTKAVDYRLVAEVYRLPQDATGAGMAELKAASIPINVTGTLDDMKIRPDLAGLLKARAKQEVHEKVQEKKGQIKKKLQDRLKGLLGE